MICVNAESGQKIKLIMRSVNAPQHLVQSIIVVCCPLNPLFVRQKRDGSPFRKPSVKVIKITASIRLYVWITVWWSYWFLIRRQLNARRWWCPLGRWKILRRTKGWYIT